MNILVLNGGSSSQKSALYSITANELPDRPLSPLWQAQIDWGTSGETGDGDRPTLQVTTATATHQSVLPLGRGTAMTEMLTHLWTGPTQVIGSAAEIDVIGHRVVHGGRDYQQSTWVTPAVKAAIAQLAALAPAHNPVNLEGIEAMEALLPQVPQVAVFDTAFHGTMPDAAAIYPGPYDWVEQGIRRYGFHGISHKYCTQRATQILGDCPPRLIICHLGNGCSLSAVQAGHSIDTTMGFTPLDGLMMGSRSGAVDPGILLYLLRQGWTVEQLDRSLNGGSGLRGISGVSHDMRQIQAAIAQGNARAQLAWDIYLHRLRSGIGAMVSSLGGLDALVFTAGVGEHSPLLRSAVCEGLAFLGIQLDKRLNDQSPADQVISAPNSAVQVMVIHTQEDWAIAQDCWHLWQQKGA